MEDKEGGREREGDGAEKVGEEGGEEDEAGGEVERRSEETGDDEGDEAGAPAEVQLSKEELQQGAASLLLQRCYRGHLLRRRFLFLPLWVKSPELIGGFTWGLQLRRFRKRVEELQAREDYKDKMFLLGQVLEKGSSALPRRLQVIRGGDVVRESARGSAMHDLMVFCLELASSYHEDGLLLQAQFLYEAVVKVCGDATAQGGRRMRGARHMELMAVDQLSHIHLKRGDVEGALRMNEMGVRRLRKEHGRLPWVLLQLHRAVILSTMSEHEEAKAIIDAALRCMDEVRHDMLGSEQMLEVEPVLHHFLLLALHNLAVENFFLQDHKALTTACQHVMSMIRFVHAAQPVSRFLVFAFVASARSATLLVKQGGGAHRAVMASDSRSSPADSSPWTSTRSLMQELIASGSLDAIWFELPDTWKEEMSLPADAPAEVQLQDSRKIVELVKRSDVLDASLILLFVATMQQEISQLREGRGQAEDEGTEEVSPQLTWQSLRDIIGDPLLYAPHKLPRELKVVLGMKMAQALFQLGRNEEAVREMDQLSPDWLYEQDDSILTKDRKRFLVPFYEAAVALNSAACLVRLADFQQATERSSRVIEWLSSVRSSRDRAGLGDEELESMLVAVSYLMGLALAAQGHLLQALDLTLLARHHLSNLPPGTCSRWRMREKVLRLQALLASLLHGREQQQEAEDTERPARAVKTSRLIPSSLARVLRESTGRDKEGEGEEERRYRWTGWWQREDPKEDKRAAKRKQLMLPYKSLTRARDRRDGMRTASKSHGEATEKSKTGSSFALPLASSPRMMDRIDLRTIRMHSRMLYDEVVTTSDLWSFKRKESLHASSAVNGGSSLPPLQRVKNERVLDLASRPFYWAHPPPPASQLVVAPYGLKPSLVYQQL